MTRRRSAHDDARADFELWLALHGFTTEARFHPTRKWRFDYAHMGCRIAVEYDGIIGGTVGYGDHGHRTVNGLLRDAEKSNEGQVLGWIVLRVNAKTIADGVAQRQIEAALAARGVMV